MLLLAKMAHNVPTVFSDLWRGLLISVDIEFCLQALAGSCPTSSDSPVVLSTIAPPLTCYYPTSYTNRAVYAGQLRKLQHPPGAILPSRAAVNWRVMPIIPPEKHEPVFDAAAGTHTRVWCDVTGEGRGGWNGPTKGRQHSQSRCTRGKVGRGSLDEGNVRGCRCSIAR